MAITSLTAVIAALTGSRGHEGCGYRSWLDPSDQFDRMTDILRERQLLDSAQRIMAAVTAASVLVPVASLVSTWRPNVGLVRVDATAAFFILGVSVFTLRRWPTRIQSQRFAIIAAAIIAGWSVAQPTVALAAVGCSAMAINNSYIAFFHSNRLLLFKTASAAVVAVFVAGNWPLIPMSARRLWRCGCC